MFPPRSSSLLLTCADARFVLDGLGRSAPQSDPDSLTIGSHSDFGSITLLDNNMTGGLQVLPPGKDEWMYVKVRTRDGLVSVWCSVLRVDRPLTLYIPSGGVQPLEGHIVCNIADALSILSGGILFVFHSIAFTILTPHLLTWL